MKFFGSKRIDLPQELKNSKQNFRFDQDRVKARLMYFVDVRHLNKDDAKRLTFKPAVWPKYAFSASLALVLLASTSGLAFASNRATPGDILFAVQKAQNNIILSLPLPESKKDEIRTDIVAKRISEFNKIENVATVNPSKIQASIDESQKSFDEAFSHLPQAQSSNVEPKSSSDEGIDDDLITKLEDLSAQHEARLESLKSQVNDEKIKDQINQSLDSLKSSREKLEKLRNQNGKNKNSSGLDKTIIKTPGTNNNLLSEPRIQFNKTQNED